jgi:hypothetical protein
MVVLLGYFGLEVGCLGEAQAHHCGRRRATTDFLVFFPDQACDG